MHKVTRENLITHHDAHPLTLDLFITKLFGPEWWEWEPETIQKQIRDELYTYPTEHVWNKLQAVRTVHVAPEKVFDQWECFLPVITSFNNVIPDFNTMQVPTAARLYNGVGILKMLDPEETFADEVRKFIASALLHEGIFFAPGELEFAQEFCRRPYYECEECGNIEDLLYEHDGICDACQKEYFSKIIGALRPGAKKTTHVQYRHDEAPVKTRFQQVAHNWDEYKPDDDDPIDVQICRIAAAMEYKAIRDAQFLEQKRILNL